MAKASPVPQLKLPKRFEILERDAKTSGIEIKDIVERVDAAADRIQTILRFVRDGGTGQFEVFYGDSGSGKTTFLRTLPKFFEGVSINIIPRTVRLIDIAEYIRGTKPVDPMLPLYVIDGRDNASVTPGEADDFFESLRLLFREAEGQVLVVWPMTKGDTAKLLAESAWKIGADSVAAVDTKGLYNFVGLDKSKYYSVANITAQSLTGDGLEAFSLPQVRVQPILQEVDTIGAFYARLEQESAKIRNQTWDLLKERTRPRVWIILAGDEVDSVDLTVTGLTQGRKTRVDIELLIDYLDDRSNEAAYLSEWRKRRSDIAFLMRTLDVRLLSLPPNAALSAVRCFGTEITKGALRKQSENREGCIDTLRKTWLYKSLLEEVGGASATLTYGRKPSKETEEEYRRVQQQAASNDKGLNKALGLAIKATLEADGYAAIEVTTEKRNIKGTFLQPDIQIKVSDAEVICIEPT